MTERYDIRYKPLFDQTEPGIWDTFLDIEIAARAAHGLKFDDADVANILYHYHKDWQESNNIAFGAFLDGKMVGFANGFMIEPGEYKLASLFVRPELQRQGIGRKLIKSFENSAALDGSFVQGLCYEWAETFYQKQGYITIHGKSSGIEMSKELPKKLGKGVFPMFSKWCTKDIKPKTPGLRVDKKLLNDSSRQPVFVSVNEKSQIDVVGVKTKDNVDVIWVSDKIPEDIKKCREMSVRWHLDAVKSR